MIKNETQDKKSSNDLRYFEIEISIQSIQGRHLHFA